MKTITVPVMEGEGFPACPIPEEITLVISNQEQALIRKCMHFMEEVEIHPSYVVLTLRLCATEGLDMEDECVLVFGDGTFIWKAEIGGVEVFTDELHLSD